MLARTRNGRRLMTEGKLSELSGLSHSTIAILSSKTSWSGVRIDTIAAFTTACGVDPFHPGKTLRYLRRSRLAHLYLAKQRQKSLAAKLLKLVFKKH